MARVGYYEDVVSVCRIPAAARGSHDSRMTMTRAEAMEKIRDIIKTSIID